MRFNKQSLMKKTPNALVAIAHVEGIDATGIERTREDLSKLILLMATRAYPHSGPPPGPGFEAPRQDPAPGASPRILRIRKQAEAEAA